MTPIPSRSAFSNLAIKTSRRAFIRLTSIASGCLLLPELAYGARELELQETVEEIKSDFDAPSEFLKRSDRLAFAPASKQQLAQFPKRDPRDMALGLLKRAEHYASLKINREANRREITQYLNLVDQEFLYENGKPVPYCAAGISFAACEAFCSFPPPIGYRQDDPVADFQKLLPIIDAYYFRPSASVARIQADAISRKTWLPESKDANPKRGWLVIFSFVKSRRPSHVGLLRGASRKSLDTIEFNTTVRNRGNQSDGGCVARRTRSRMTNCVLGYVQLYA